MPRSRWIKPNLVAVSALALAWPALVAADTGVVRYPVKRGDSLYQLAQRYCLHTTDNVALQKLNRIRNPRRMPVGQVLAVPKSLLRVETATARVIAFRGNVRVMRGAQDMLVATGGEIREGDTIVTRINSFVTLLLTDGTSVSLPSQSTLRLARLRRILLTNAIDRNFSILAGQAESTVHALSRPDDSFRFSTPNSVSTVRGTQLRVSYDPEALQSRTEVLEGKVEVASPGGRVTRMLPAGAGAIGHDGLISEARPLLPSPALLRPATDQDDPELHFAIDPVAGATAYRTEIARDAGFLEIVADSRSGPDAVLPAVEDGSWFVRISAIAGDQLQGFGKIYSFRRRLNSTDLTPAARREGAGGEYLFRWRSSGNGQFQYRFQLFAKSDPDHPVVDELGLKDQNFTLTRLTPGDYQWRVETIQFLDGQVYEKWSANQEFTVSKK